MTSLCAQSAEADGAAHGEDCSELRVARRPRRSEIQSLEKIRARRAKRRWSIAALRRG